MGNKELWDLTSIVRRKIDSIKRSRLKNKDCRDNIIIFGTPRSGSTWIQEILSAIPGYSSLMEPFHPSWFPRVSEIDLKPRTYKKIGEEWKNGEEYLQDVFNGKVISTKPHFKLSPDSIHKRIFSDNIVIKFVRANRLLPWILDTFQIKHSLLIIRHPCAVISSQMRTGFSGYNPCDLWGEDRFPEKDDILREFKDLDFIDHEVMGKIQRTDSLEEYLAITWCLDNYVPLKYGQGPRVVTTYEDILTRRGDEIERIIDGLGIVRSSQKSKKMIDKPSEKTAREDEESVKDINKQLSRWRDSFEKEQIDDIMSVLGWFNIDFYDQSLKPDHDELEEFIG